MTKQTMDKKLELIKKDLLSMQSGKSVIKRTAIESVVYSLLGQTAKRVDLIITILQKEAQE